jgi:hypothetical protein
MSEKGLKSGPEVRNARVLVQAAGLIFYLLAVQALFTAGVGLDVYFKGGSASDLLLPATSFVLAASYVLIGYFLRRYRVWARNFAFAFAAVSLFAFPAGTILGVLVVLCIGRASRGGVFLQLRGTSIAAPAAVEALEDEPILRLEPELATEHAG